MRFLRTFVTSVVMMLMVILSAGCTPEQVQFWSDHISESRPAAIEKGMTDEGLARLRACESGGNYNAVNPSGKYRGAYQFDQRTWDSVASRWAPFLVGQDPAYVEPAWQDHLALGLFSERGRSPWPECGKRI